MGAHGGVHAISHGWAHAMTFGGPHGGARDVAPGATLVVGPRATPTVAPPCIDIDALFAFVKLEVIILEQSILSFNDGLYRDICVTICRSL